jgi:hypothetical protein
MQPTQILRLEGATAAAVALFGYFSLGGPLWLLALLALAPDLSMLGYVAGPKTGSRVYNIGHTYTVPGIVGALGVWANVELAILVALVWIGHLGIDRLVGYGLKYETGFKDTHLSGDRASRSNRAVTR